MIGFSAASCSLFLPDVVNSSPITVGVFWLECYSNFSAEGEVVLSVFGNASNGVAVGFKAASNVNFGFPGFAF
ncbi:hypothetical protein Tco_1564774 [Tanacetum coccineum]